MTMTHVTRRPSRFVAALAGLALIAAACGSDKAADDVETTESAAPDTGDGATSDAPDDTAAEPADGDYSDLKVVLVLDGAVDDGGWSEAHARAGEEIVAAFPGSTVDYVEEIAKLSGRFKLGPAGQLLTGDIAGARVSR